MDVMQELGNYKEKVDSRLKNFFDKEIEEFGYSDNIYSIFLSFLKEYTLRGGKRIRPAFVYYSYLLFADRTNSNEKADITIDEVITISMIPELKQTFFLGHDDFMDLSDKRRGGKSLHKMFEKFYQNIDGIVEKKIMHQSNSMAVLAGNFANALSEKIILNTDLPIEKKNTILEILNKTDISTLYGQALDVHSGILPEILTEEELLEIHLNKSAKYTIESPLLIGAELAGASEEQQKILSDYAIPLGQAFQIEDDNKGLFGDEKKLGKPADSDLKEGKNTLLIIKALEKADNLEKKVIYYCLGNQDIDSEMIETVRDIVISTGSLDYSVNLAKDLISESKEYLNQLENVNPDAKEFLLAFADYMLDREH
ncbi:MAG: polyprenyl synthetase family protein [Candidatus Aenigmarchaeota archaeon]|nr:polyprenyl synthetase family protein [Candidatus Aenigmarchaeota archaeon]